ncbi:General transcription factor II-I repeat domain-containing protein 2-like [Caligus rogercresseyi]|uniref:General transcription factor II-I repeat domain-containing protein 2-like n=1 Tax=Caligus rogercresseyi TaxID=217165 RepID=A0A7T8KLX8_CALRO|nr:General transcription factor II-I repeat domain-containing protein 2-like [Caligus rogercresseyi]
MQSKNLIYPQLEDTERLEKLHFLVYMTNHLNKINRSLQGRGNTALQMLEAVLSFERKLTVLARDIQRETLSHFPSQRKFREAHPDINHNYLQGVTIEMQK